MQHWAKLCGKVAAWANVAPALIAAMIALAVKGLTSWARSRRIVAKGRNLPLDLISLATTSKPSAQYLCTAKLFEFGYRWFQVPATKPHKPS
jgi:hypothetical protein